MVRANTAVSRLKDYIPIVEESTIDELRFLAAHLKGARIQHISHAQKDDGIAQMLGCVIPLVRELGVDIEWDTIEADSEFLNVTKKFRNAIYGKPEIIIDRDFDIYLDGARNYNEKTRIKGDIVFVHDIAPIALIQNKKKLKKTKWVWDCHVDASSPNDRVWAFISTFVEGYDASIFSSPKFTSPVKIPQFLICPAIDPLSDKNRSLSESDIDNVLYKYGIDKKKPIVTQIARFDYLKDQEGVLEAFKMLKRYVDAQLILAGTRVPDDPESEKMLVDLKAKAKDIDDIHILVLPSTNADIEINALQRASSVIVQKPIKEGFGLAVTEALWKTKPVVASAVGGIPLQIKHKHSGLLCHSVEGAALEIRQFLHNPAFAKRLAHNGMLHVKHNFLITRLIMEHMLLIISLSHDGDVIIL